MKLSPLRAALFVNADPVDATLPQGAGYQPLAVDTYPGFTPVQVKYSEWLNPAPEHEGERILWSDGSAHGVPEDDSEFVTVLRSRAPS